MQPKSHNLRSPRLIRQQQRFAVTQSSDVDSKHCDRRASKATKRPGKSNPRRKDTSFPSKSPRKHLKTVTHRHDTTTGCPSHYFSRTGTMHEAMPIETEGPTGNPEQPVGKRSPQTHIARSARLACHEPRCFNPSSHKKFNTWKCR